MKIEHFPVVSFLAAGQDLSIQNFKEFIATSKEYIYNPHRLDSCMLIYLQKGVGKHLLCDKRLNLKEGDILLISPKHIHTFVSTDDNDGWVLFFNVDFFIGTIKPYLMEENFKVINDMEGINQLRPSDSERSILDELFALLYTANQDQQVAGKRSINQHIVSSVIQLLTRMQYIKGLKNEPISNKHNDIAHQYQALVKKNVLQERNLEFYLKNLDISQTTLQNAVKQSYGVTPKQIIDSEFIILLKKQLANPIKQIQEIAYEAGFDEPSNFAKFFKKMAGLAPQEYRNSL